jgi:hypothetical protein
MKWFNQVGSVFSNTTTKDNKKTGLSESNKMSISKVFS